MTRVELRVHGVSGTPPEDMLGTDRACQVHGDDFGRVFRRADRLGNVLDPDDGIEAYHWGKQTSGSPLQGLWLLLAPFGMVNAAQFMLEIPKSDPTHPRRLPLADTAYRVAGWALRLTGLALTLMFVLTATIITVDLWAWQRERASTGAAFVLALVGPVVLVGFYLLVARTTAKLNTPPDADPKTATRGDDFGRVTGLLRPGFFEGDPDVPALRALHVAAGLALVALVAFGKGADGDPLGWWGVGVSGGLLALASVTVVFLGDPEGSADTGWGDPAGRRPRLHVVSRRPVRVAVVLAGLVVLLAAAVHLWRLPIPGSAEVMRDGVLQPRGSTHFGWLDEASLGVMLGAVVGLVALALSNGALAWLCRDSPARHGVVAFAPYAKGMACTLVATVGVFLGVGFAGAFTTALAELMSTEQRPVEVPELLSRITYAWGLTVGLIVLVVIVEWLRWRSRRSDFDARAEVELGVPTGENACPAPRWVRTVSRAMWRARLKNRAPFVLTTFAVFGALLTLFTMLETWPMLVGSAPQDGGPVFGWVSGSANEELKGWTGVVRNAAVAVGALALSGLAGLLLTLGRRALSGEAARRGANVIWDVIAFRPRSAHPFVPATYAQRAVPDLENRIAHHLTPASGSPDTVVLCGHSQGSLLSFAALLRLATDPGRKHLIGRVALVTFGSQLQVMFARGFPGYVNHATIERLYQTLEGRWRNLYRSTDPLAGPVLSWRCPDGHDRPGPDGRCHIGAPVGSGTDSPHRREYGPDWRIFDPPNPPGDPEPRRGTTFLPLRGHSDFWLDPAWDDAVEAVSDRGTRPDGQLAGASANPS